MTSSPFLLSLVAASLCLQNVAGRPWAGLDKSSSSRHFSHLAEVSESGHGRAARSGLSAKQGKEVCESLRTVLRVCSDDTINKLLTNTACKALMKAARSLAKEIEVDCDLSISRPWNPAFSGTRLCSAIQTVLFRAQCQAWQQATYSPRCFKIRQIAKFFTRNLKLTSCDIDDKPNTTLPSSPASPATTTKQATTISTSTSAAPATTLPTTTATTVTTSPTSATTTTTTPLMTTAHTTPSETITTTSTALPETTATTTQDSTTETLPAMTSLTTTTTTTTAIPSDTTTAVTAQVNECLANQGVCFAASRCEGNSVAMDFAPCPGTGMICCLYLF